MVKLEAVVRIEQWWIGVRNRRVFTVLKKAICAAEHSLTSEVLRKISPNEAELLKDPTLQAKLKFRFGGSSFPPVVLFKIFTSLASRGGGGVQYMSGKRMIKPASQAAEDARTQMGNRVFYDQMLSDACQHHQLKITDEVDVATVKDYMQYMTNLDESPAFMGGRENTWRKINLDVLPRHSFLHSLVEFLEQAHFPSGLSLQRLQSLAHPPSQAQQIDHIKVVTSLSTQSVISPRRRLPSSQGSSRGPSRRSRQAQQRVERMKKAYEITKLPSTSPEVERPPSNEEDDSRHQEHLVSDDDVEIEEWDKEVCELYQWSKQLSFDDIR